MMLHTAHRLHAIDNYNYEIATTSDSLVVGQLVYGYKNFSI